MWVLKLRILPFVCSNVAREGIKLHRAWGFSEDFRLFNKELPHLGGIHGLLYSFGAFFGTTAMAEQRYCVDYARRGMAGCKKCKEKITKGLPRIGKIIPNPFSDGGGDMKEWYHIRCVFEKLERSRPNTKRIEALSDLEGNELLEDSEKELILQLIKDLAEKIAASPAHRKAMQSRLEKSSLLDATVPSASAPRKFSGFSAIPLDSNGASKPGPGSSPPAPSSTSPLTSTKGDPTHKDSSFREFRKLCAVIAEQASYNSKTQIVHDFIRKGTGGDGFRGDVYLTMKMLLPGVVKSVYNVSDKQLVKLFSRVFNCNHDDMVTDLEKGDVPETVRLFFEASKNCPRAAKSHLSLQEVDIALTQLSQLTKEEEQQQALHDIASRCTSNDLKCIVRLIKHDLRMNAGAKHILDGLDPNAYEAFKASRDLRDVVDRVLSNWKVSQETTGVSSSLTVSATLMIPVQPMLAEACKSVEYAMKKCPNGMYSEIKYDGERVQVHKKANEFQYYSRSLKPVLPHKVAHFKDYIPQAFPGGDSLILDAEVLLIDCKTSQPLPFGSLGIHKKAAFRDANVCLFVFDCIYFNGQSLMDRPIKERRKFLHENMIEIPNHVLFSEMQHVTKAADLAEMITRVIREGLEGLVLKDVMSVYEPGKRHWLKVKKDYLHSGAMADTADLVVIGAYYGHGSKGGIMSVFLMGCYDPALDIWCTVSKCGIGLDDATLARLQNDLDMIKISKDPKKIPGWLKINKNYYPDFISLDPKNAPVWEITGAEFSKAEAHTAGGISIRFPRVTRFRDDKDWQTATNLPQLQTLFSKSKEKFVATELLGTGETSGSSPSSPSREGRTDNKQIAGSRGTKAGAAAPAKARSRKAVPVKADPGKAAAVKANPKKNVIEKMQSIKETTRSAGVKRKVEDKEPEQTLLDIFSGVRLFLPSTVEGYEQARRYFVAYNGDLVPDHELATATHVVGRNAGEAQPVTIDWIWKCIKRRKVVLPC